MIEARLIRSHGWMATCSRWLIITLVSLRCIDAGAVQKADLPLSDFVHTVWSQRDGIPLKVFALAQTEDGWLWLGGPNGLYQFDGVKAEEIKAENGGHLFVSVLYAMPSGELVIGKIAGGISIYDHGRFKHFDDPSILKAGRITNFARDAEGTLWVTCENAVLRFDGKQFVAVGEAWGITPGGAVGAGTDQHGTLWLTSRKRIWRLPKGTRKFIGMDMSGDAMSIRQAPDGLSWLLDEKKATLLPDQASGEIRAGETRRMSDEEIFDTDGYLWSYSATHLDFPYPSIRGLDYLGLHLTTAIEDRQKNIWFGSNNGDLHRFRRRLVTEITTFALPVQVVPAAFFPASNGKVWIDLKSPPGYGAFQEEGAWLFDKTMRRVQPELRSGGVMARAPNGDLWFTNIGILWQLNGERFERVLALPQQWDNEPPTSLAVGCAGGLWLASPNMGLWRNDGSSWQRNGSIAGLPDEAPTRQLCDSDLRLWLGYRDGTILQLDGDRVDRSTTRDGLAVGSVVDISVGTRVLVVGEQGLSLVIDGRFTTLVAARPSAFEGLTGVTQAANGDVWLNGPSGMGLVRGRDLPTSASGAAHPVPMQLFDATDGYPGPGFTRPRLAQSIAIDDLDRVWVAGLEGIGYLHADLAKPEKEPSKALIRAVSVNDQFREAAGTLDLPEGTRSLRFDYTALNYTHPERLRFRHRLEGVDPDWIVDEGRREANYANMGPGTFRFAVEASDESGAWQGAPTSMSLTIAPTFWQSWYFTALCVLVFIALAVGTHRLRLRQVAGRQKRLLEERLFERERIARELHDTLLQGTQALIFKIHALANGLPADGPLRHRLGDAADVAQRAMNEARDRIQALRSDPDSPDDLEPLLIAIGAEAVHGTAVAFSVNVQGTSRALNAPVSEAACLIAREALRNATRHANAQAIELQLVYTDEGLRMMVRDDGCGIDESKLLDRAAPRHWGLKGMQERAHEVGGELTFWSRAGAGTEIELRVPADVAYQEPHVVHLRRKSESAAGE